MTYRNEHVKQLQALANPGADELFCLGEHHLCGEGGVGSWSRALPFFQRAVAADASNGKALYRLADCKGNDTAHASRLYTQAFPLLQQQAKASPNDAHAQYLLGHCYFFGHGVTEDQPKAHIWYKKAAMQGHARAQARFGEWVRCGRGVAQDIVESLCWYAQAARQGDSRAANMVDAVLQYGDWLNPLTNRANKNCNDYLAASALAYIYGKGVVDLNGYRVVATNAELASHWKERAEQCTEPIPLEWFPSCLLSAAASKKRKRGHDESTEAHQNADTMDKEEAAETAKSTQRVERTTKTSAAAAKNDSAQQGAKQGSSSSAMTSLSLPARVAKLEQVYGSNLLARVAWLETSMGLQAETGTLPKRVDKLEQVAESPPPDGLSLPARVQRLEGVYGSNLVERVTWLESVIGASGESGSLPERLDRLEDP